jgi:hypothetical protein
VTAADSDETDIHNTALRIETAAGKTKIAIKWACEAVRNGLKVVVAVPRHNLADELVARFAELGVSALAFRGYEAIDPLADGDYEEDDEDRVEQDQEHPDARVTRMCRQRAAYRDATRACIPVKKAVCKTRRKEHGREIEHECKRAAVCGMMRQANQTPQIWIITHAMLYQQKPSYIPDPDILIIDERFYTGALPTASSRTTLDSLNRRSIDIQVFEQNKPGLVDQAATRILRGHIQRLVCALISQSEDGWVERQALERHGFTADVASNALLHQWRCIDKPNIYPGMDPRQRSVLAKAAERVNRQVLELCGIWHEVRELLASGYDASGRMRIVHDSESEARMLERSSLSTVKNGWRTNTLILDATLPDAAILGPILQAPVEVAADIAVPWSEHGHTRQILFAPVSASVLGIVPDKGKDPSDRRVIGDLLGFISLRAALALPAFHADCRKIVAVVGQQKLIAKLVAAGLPPNVEVGHFGNLSGLDKWATAAGMIVIGRPLPGPKIVEAQAGAITGKPPTELEPNEHGIAWYSKVDGGIRLWDGTAVAVKMDRHPDPVAEALRWQACEAEIIQAIGRLRLLRRGERDPYFLDIIGDVVLPIVVDSATTWEQAFPGPCTRLVPFGVLLQSPTDIARGFPELRLSARAAETVADASRLNNWFAAVDESARTLRWLKYQLQGSGKKPTRGIILPNAPCSLREDLERRLGPMAQFEVTEASWRLS